MQQKISLLKTFWECTLQNKQHSDWNAEIKAISECGKGIEETLRYLYFEKPSFENFIQWINIEANSNIISFDEDVLTQDEINFFNENGYLVFRNAVTDEQCNAAKNAITEHLKIDLNDPSTWYLHHEEKGGLMLMFYHHPALNDNRTSPRIKKAFEQLYRSEKIHLIIDKVSFNPPETSSYKFAGSPLHWDVSLALPIPFKLQGLLYLNDVEANGGAFQCVPGFHNEIEQWLMNLSLNVNPRTEALLKLIPQPIAGRAGDFIIWHQALPHCASANHSATPRFVQYITYDPDDMKEHEVWK